MSRPCALVTGAAGGIGSAIAKSLAKEGFLVAIHGRNEDARLNALRDEINEERSFIVTGNISKEEDCKKIIEAVMAEGKTIDVLVNNAGITKDNIVLRMSAEDFDGVIDTNLKSAFFLSKEAFKYMMKARAGKIINITSIVGIRGNAAQANYAAAKAGLIGLTKTFAKEFASRNIKVNAVAPGFIESPMTDKLDDRIVKEMMEHIPLKRLGKPEDVADIVSFLASSKADYITGQVLSVDGGMNI